MYHCTHKHSLYVHYYIQRISHHDFEYNFSSDDRIPSREELDVALLKARQDTVIKDMAGQHNIPQFTTVAPAQLPLLAKLAVATSSGRVRILVAHVSTQLIPYSFPPSGAPAQLPLLAKLAVAMW